MGVTMQAFYWDCQKLEDQEYRWWNHVTGKIPSLCQAGFAALWLPPANKAANIGGASMGYDPYGYYVLDKLNQKGSTPNGGKRGYVVYVPGSAAYLKYFTTTILFQAL